MPDPSRLPSGRPATFKWLARSQTDCSMPSACGLEAVAQTLGARWPQPAFIRSSTEVCSRHFAAARVAEPSGRNQPVAAARPRQEKTIIRPGGLRCLAELPDRLCSVRGIEHRGRARSPTNFAARRSCSGINDLCAAGPTDFVCSSQRCASEQPCPGALPATLAGAGGGLGRGPARRGSVRAVG